MPKLEKSVGHMYGEKIKLSMNEVRAMIFSNRLYKSNKVIDLYLSSRCQRNLEKYAKSALCCYDLEASKFCTNERRTPHST